MINKSTKITITASPAEVTRLKKEAKKAGMTKAKFLRTKAGIDDSQHGAKK